MMREFAVSVWREGEWYVAQAPEVDVASQGESEEEALENLREALGLHFEGAAHAPQSCHATVRLSSAHSAAYCIRQA